MSFAQCLNNIQTSVPHQGSTEDLMLQQCELKVTPADDTYPRHATHVYAQKNIVMIGMKTCLHLSLDSNIDT